jgi:hypothetical protein
LFDPDAQVEAVAASGLKSQQLIRARSKTAETAPLRVNPWAWGTTFRRCEGTTEQRIGRGSGQVKRDLLKRPNLQDSQSGVIQTSAGSFVATDDLGRKYTVHVYKMCISGEHDLRLGDGTQVIRLD